VTRTNWECLKIQFGYLVLYGSLYGLFTDRSRPWIGYFICFVVGVKLEVSKYKWLGYINRKLIMIDFIFLLITLILSTIFVLALRRDFFYLNLFFAFTVIFLSITYTKRIK